MRAILVVAASIISIATAQESTRSKDVVAVRGTVFDEVTQRPLPFARVQIAGSGRRAFTDSVGRYEIDSVEIRTFSVQAEAIGYIREIRDVEAPFPPHVVCGVECKPWRPVVVLNFFMRRRPEIQS